MSADISSKAPAKRACDACKVRKVRCSNTTPCAGCVAIGTSCTFNKQQGTRGPRRLKAKTIQHIAESQRHGDELTPPMVQAARQTPPVMAVGASPSPTSPTLLETQLPLPPLISSPPAANSPSEVGTVILTPVATLVLHLCVYRLRMFPVWPIVAVEDLMAALQKDNSGMEAYALSNAIAAATIVQARLDPLKNSAEVVTAESMEREVQRLGTMGRRKLNLHHVRIAFFLHAYHENLDPGGTKSLLYLRESITMAQIMGLHKESSYRDISPEEQQFQKRVVWLLFITERTIALLHHLPAILRLNISFPAMEYDKDVSILPAFRSIVNLYWTLDQSSEVFDMLQDSKHSSSTPSILSHNKLCLLQKKLQDITIDSSATNHVQAADFCITRAWMCALIWRVAGCEAAPQSNEQTTSISYPIQVAQELLEQISNLPRTALEAHGLSIELKIYDIACSILDLIAKPELKSAQWEDLNPREVLNRLQNILSTYRGGNTTLVKQISDRLARMQSEPPAFPEHGEEQDIFRDYRGTRRHSQQPVAFVSNTQVGHNDLIGSFSTVVLDPYHGSPDYSQVSQPMSFPWDSIAAEAQSHFGSSVEQTDESAAFDGFLHETMRHTNHLMARSNQHSVDT